MSNEDQRVAPLQAASAATRTPATSSDTCWSCGGNDTTYQAFSGGREYYCRTCEDVFPYREGQAPRRVQMIREGRFAELREEMRTQLASQPPTSEASPQ